MNDALQIPQQVYNTAPHATNDCFYQPAMLPPAMRTVCLLEQEKMWLQAAGTSLSFLEHGALVIHFEHRMVVLTTLDTVVSGRSPFSSLISTLKPAARRISTAISYRRGYQCNFTTVCVLLGKLSTAIFASTARERNFLFRSLALTLTSNVHVHQQHVWLRQRRKDLHPSDDRQVRRTL